MEKRNAFKFFSITCMLLSLVLAGCDIGASQPTAHSFRQEYDNVVKIEIAAYDHNKRTNTWQGQFVDENCFSPLVQLSDEDCGSLLQDILSLEIKKFYMIDPILDYGDVVILIYYTNNEIEMIGITNIGWISPNGELDTTDKRFEISAICDVISKYVDPEVLNNVSDYFPKLGTE